MPLFALPLDKNHTRPTQRQIQHPNPTRLASILKKRKRDASTSPAPSADDEASKPTLSAAIRNPLALGPDEIEQYRLAGLEIDQPLPQVEEPDFAHKALVSKGRDGFDAETEERKKSRLGKEVRLRTRHVGVLTAVLHRCLAEGDIARASRAWSLLLRVQVNGVGMELRESGYWGIGAELLIRQGEKPARGLLGLDGKMREEDVIENDENEEKNSTEPRRWGSKAGLERAKDYFERLILQYPYRRQFHNSINALDFWPAMLGCEIYGIQYEQKQALQLLQAQEQNEEFTPSDVDNSDNEELAAADGEDFYHAQEKRDQRREARKREHFRQEKELVRGTALTAAEKVALRMDELMALPPFSDSHVLLRLRGMVALYVGDLNVPHIENGEEEEQGRDEDSERGLNGQERMLERQRRSEWERDLGRRSEEREKAKALFEKIKKGGGEDYGRGIFSNGWNGGVTSGYGEQETERSAESDS